MLLFLAGSAFSEELYTKLPDNLASVINNMHILKQFDFRKTNGVRVYEVDLPGSGECLNDDYSDYCKLKRILIIYSNFDVPRIEEAYLFKKMWSFEIIKLNFISEKNCVEVEYNETIPKNYLLDDKTKNRKRYIEILKNGFESHKEKNSWISIHQKVCLKVRSMKEILGLM